MSAFFVLTSMLGFVVFVILFIVAAIRKRPKKTFGIVTGVCFLVFIVSAVATGSTTDTSDASTANRAVLSAESSDMEKPKEETTPKAEKVKAEKATKEKAAKAKAEKEASEKAKREKAAKEKAEKEAKEKKKAEREKAAKEKAEKKTAEKKAQQKKAANEKAEQKKKPEPQKSTRSYSQAVSLVEASVKKKYGSNYNLTHDEESVTIQVWVNGAGNEAYIASTGDADSINAWSKRVYALRDFSSAMVQELARAGYSERSVNINLLNDQNTDNTLLTVRNGEVTYNWVESDEALANDTKNITVYITDTGKKYHIKGCRALDDSQYPISLEDAINSGYSPCGICGPPVEPR